MGTDNTNKIPNASDAPPFRPPQHQLGHQLPQASYMGHGPAHHPLQHSHQQVPKPVSSKIIPNTDWLEVLTDTGIPYWHNKKTGESTWVKPEQVTNALRKSIERRNRQPPQLNPLQQKMLERALKSGAQIAPQYDVSKALTYKNNHRGDNGNEAHNGDEYDVTFTEDDVDEDVKNGSNQSKQHPSNTPSIPETVANPIDEYKSLLAELHVHGFSRYEKELPKLQNDARFKAVPENQRRKIFDEYCTVIGLHAKETMKDEKAASTHTEKEQKLSEKDKKAAEIAFKAALQEHVTKSDISWHTFCEKIGKKSSLQNISSSRQEELFRSHKEGLVKIETARYRAEKRARDTVYAAEERRKHAGRLDAINNCKALLAEMIRESDIEWDEAWPRLELDPQRRAMNEFLDKESVRRFFEEHIEDLVKREEAEGSEEDEEGDVESEEGEVGEEGAKRARIH